FAPASGWLSPNSARSAIRPGISCSASRISLRPHSASERSRTRNAGRSSPVVIIDSLWTAVAIGLAPVSRVTVVRLNCGLARCELRVGTADLRGYRGLLLYRDGASRKRRRARVSAGARGVLLYDSLSSRRSERSER